MAVLEATNVSVFNHSTVTGPRVTSANKRIFSCYVTGEFTGTYAQADNARFTNLHTEIANSLRSGSAVALVDAAFAQIGSESDGTLLGAKTVAVSGSNVTMELTTGDLSTEHGNAAIVNDDPLAFAVTYTVDP